MSDLIRRDDLLDLYVLKDKYYNDYVVPYTVVIQNIKDMTAVDAVEVVRCSRCVNNPRIGTKTKGMVWCRKFRSEVRPDGFCSYGGRREENVVD